MDILEFCPKCKNKYIEVDFPNYRKCTDCNYYFLIIRIVKCRSNEESIGVEFYKLNDKKNIFNTKEKYISVFANKDHQNIIAKINNKEIDLNLDYELYQNITTEKIFEIFDKLNDNIIFY